MAYKPKIFTIIDVHFTQRPSDSYIDATQICQSKGKPFANWFRTKKTTSFLDQYPNAVLKTNKHAWIRQECLKNLLDWVLRVEYDYSLVHAELVKDFELDDIVQPPVTTKVCSKCKEELSLDLFGPNKLKKDGYDIRCKGCHKETRILNADHHAERSLDYYNKDKSAAYKAEWAKKNRDKTRAASKRAYAKKIRLQKEAEAKEAEEEEEKSPETRTQFNQIVLKNKDGNPYQVISREEDGYVDVTNLCKAGGKKFAVWYRSIKTTRFLEVLSANIRSEDHVKGSERILSDPLIHMETDGTNDSRGTWVHPRIAINIAQWISPEFDVQVSKWIHQLLVIGQVRLTDQSTDAEMIDIQTAKQRHCRLISEGDELGADQTKDELEEKVDKLEKTNLQLKYENQRLSKYLERKRRVQYDKKKVIYVLAHNEFDNCYKVGIANQLTSRMSTYNTGAPDDYEIIYHQYTMHNSTVELMIRKKFADILYTSNKEWYEIDDGPDILIDAIKEAVSFFD
jgi:hypothetical protein